jgi:Ca-activated chloride channel family protein
MHGRALRINAWRELAQRGRVPRLRSFSLLLAGSMLVVALAQPRFGRILSPRMAPGQDVVLLMDVSRSMGAEDAVPTRLAVAVESAESLLAALAPAPSNRAAVVAFAGRGVLRCPLTENLGAVRDTLHVLQPGDVRPGGTDLGAGLQAAMEAFGAEEHAEGRIIVVFSDGEDHVDNWMKWMGRLKDEGVMVHCVAIGDAEQGHPVPSGHGSEPIRYQGELVRSRRTDATLEALARETEGASLEIGLTSVDLGKLYRERIAPVARRKRENARPPERPEQFPLFLGAALGSLLLGCWPVGRTTPWRWTWNQLASVLLLSAMTIATTGAVDGKQPPSSVAPMKSTIETGAELVARGEDAYSADRFEEALVAFEAAISLAPTNPIPRYNAAAALYQLKRLPEALEFYRRARAVADVRLRTKIDYALGNTLLMLGDLPGAVSSYDLCLASKARGPDLDRVREDAAINREFALQQSPPSLAPDETEASERPKSVPPRGARRKPGGGNEEPGDASEDAQRPEGSPPEGGGKQPDEAGKQRRRVGGAGGSGANQNSRRPPEDRLEEAVDRIREAQRRRLPDERSEEPVDQNRKDW